MGTKIGNALKFSGAYTEQPQNYADLYEADGEYPWDTGKRRCIALSNRGRRCGRYALKGATTCKNHGGALQDMGGRWDNAIKSEKLREKYQRIRKDEDLTDQKDDLALMRAFCEVIVEKHTMILEAEGEDNIDEAKLNAMANSIERVSRLIEAIDKRERAQENFIHAEEVVKAMQKVAEIIARNIKDRTLVATIVQEISAIHVGRRPPAIDASGHPLPPAGEMEVPTGRPTALIPSENRSLKDELGL